MGDKHAEELRRLSIELYSRGEEYARARGIILADTKFEFGLVDNKIILIDEALTPDSSRFWDMEDYETMALNLLEGRGSSVRCALVLQRGVPARAGFTNLRLRAAGDRGGIRGRSGHSAGAGRRRSAPCG